MSDDPYAGIGVAAPGAVFTDTGQAGTPAQQAFYKQLSSGTADYASAPVGSAQNPIGLRPGETPPLSKYFVDPQGNLHSPDAATQDPYAGIGAVPVSTAEDMARSAGAGLQQGATGLVGVVGDGQQLLDKVLPPHGHTILDSIIAASHPLSPDMLQMLPHLPTSEDLNGWRQMLLGQDWTPQSTAGRYTQSIAANTPAAALGGQGLMAKLLAGVLPGVGSQAAADVADKVDPGHDGGASALQNPARLGGMLAGLLLNHGIGGVARPATQLVADATPNVTPEQTKAAADLMRDMGARGVQITPVEAIQQVTKGATGLSRLLQTVESTSAGNARLAPMFAERPDQVAGAMNTYADSIAPRSTQPGMIGTAAQKAAQGGLDEVRQGINAVAEPNYSALQGQTIPPEDYAQLAGSAAYKAALDTVRGNPILNEPIVHLPDNNLAVVNEVKKEIGRSGTANAQTVMNPTGNNQVAAAYSGAGTKADLLARQASPDWQAAHDIVSGGRAAYLEPLEAGPAGKIAATDQVGQQTGALYPAKPLEGAPAETATAVRLLNGQDPQVASDLTRQHLMNNFNEFTQDNSGKPNQWGGAKFASGVGGNSEQLATLLAGVGELPGGAAKADDLERLLQGFNATGYRMQAGSPTASLTEGQALLKGSKIGQVLKEGINIAEPLSGVGHVIDKMAYRARSNALTDFMTIKPEELDAFMARARSAKNPAGTLLGQLLLQAPSNVRH